MRFVKESRIAAAPSTVFEFHERPGTLECLPPPGSTLSWLKEATHSALEAEWS